MEQGRTSYNEEARAVGQPNIWAVGAKGGLYTGLILIIFSKIQFLFEISGDNLASSIFNVISFVIGIALTHKAFRDQGNGYMSYSQGLGLGTIVGLVSGTMNALFLVVYISLVDDTMISSQLAKARIEFENQGLTDAQVDQAMYYSEMMVSPPALFFLAVIGSIFYAFLLSLLISAFTKNTDPELEF